MTFSDTEESWAEKQKNVDEWDEDERGERWYGDEMIPLAKSGDQRSAKKGKIKKGKTCEKGMF
mgnify:CR=1 FL=1